MYYYYKERLDAEIDLKKKLELSLILAMWEDNQIERKAKFKAKEGYKWTIRTGENSRHKPHFHVKNQEKSGSFKLLSGEPEKDKCHNLKSWELKKIKEWYDKYRIELIEFWNHYHTDKKIEIAKV